MVEVDQKRRFIGEEVPNETKSQHIPTELFQAGYNHWALRVDGVIIPLNKFEKTIFGLFERRRSNPVRVISEAVEEVGFTERSVAHFMGKINRKFTRRGFPEITEAIGIHGSNKYSWELADWVESLVAKPPGSIESVRDGICLGLYGAGNILSVGVDGDSIIIPLSDVQSAVFTAFSETKERFLPEEKVNARVQRVRPNYPASKAIGNIRKKFAKRRLSQPIVREGPTSRGCDWVLADWVNFVVFMEEV